MTKYSLLLYYKEYESFLENLQELGLVDITVSNWEANEEERELMQLIGRYRFARQQLRQLADAQPDEVNNAEPFSGAQETFDQFMNAFDEKERLENAIEKIGNEIETVRPWGEFDPAMFGQLQQQGVFLRFFTAYAKDYETHREEWSEKYAIEKIAEKDGKAYLVLVQYGHESPVELDIHPEKTPDADFRQLEQELSGLKEKLEEQNQVLLRAANGREWLDDAEAELRSRLQLSQALYAGESEADGKILVLEGWTPTETTAPVDEFLEREEVVYFKERPTPQDNTPVLLKNRKFPRLFEFIGNFYSLPKYGSMDLTPYFAPFYMLFFGFCLGDGGYGFLYVVAGLYMVWKMTGQMKKIGWLVFYCGLATMLFGVLSGSFFGIELGNFDLFAGVRDYFLDSNNLFILALAIGVIHILFAMSLKVVNYTRQYGIRYAWSTIGWMIVIISSLAAYLLPDAGVDGFTMTSIPYLILLGIGLFMMLFLNSPGKNPFINLGTGLWNTYNDVTGLLGDVLSYIRLFALGLCGGILAIVFNDVALGLSPDIPGVRQVVIILILLIGHGINIFMSSLSSFVHPMRLTFVEFYKNAGFEAGYREFKPLKKQKK